MKLLCLSDLHLRQEAVVDAIDRQRLSPFLGQIAATVAEVSPDAVVVTGRKEIGDNAISKMRLDADSQKIVRDEINKLTRLKYKRYPALRTAVTHVTPVIVDGEAKLKISLGDTFPEMPVPDFSDAPETLSPEQILTKRKELGLSQAKFAPRSAFP